MRKLLTIIMLLTSAFSVIAETSADSLAPRRLRDFVVWGRRPLTDVGVNKTVLDSAALKENIALSLADVLTYNSSVFVKSYGRATLSTVAFRGTSPSHTQVTWNGMPFSNPMLGMTDFSAIPSFFIDRASLLHGTSSVNETGGGLGGLVKLSTTPVEIDPGFGLQYVQGIGSFKTFDEFLRVSYGGKHLKSSTRVVYSSSPNDYKYVNRDKKENIYDDDHNIIGQYYPTERNRSGAFKDFHALQQLYYTPTDADRLGLNVWYINSNRELPMLTTDYGDEKDFENRQREQTVRSVISWDHTADSWRMALKGGYIHTSLNYLYRREITAGNWASMTDSHSRVNTVYGSGEGVYNPSRRLMLTLGLSATQHFVRSADKNVITQQGDRDIVGYDKARIELSGSASARWQPIDPLGLSLVLRQEMYGDTWAPPIPAFFVDALVSRRGNVMLKASVSKNSKFPTLNDLYFQPGGNPDLRSEKGWTYDAGLSFDVGMTSPVPVVVSGSASWFDSYIDDWIMWLPTTKGFFSPRNVKSVHAYGIESRLDIGAEPWRGWVFDLSANYSWTPSVNRGPAMSPSDKSVGRQLPYVPRHSAALTASVTWRRWSFLYKWAYYSERFTMSSNESTLTGRLPAYFMSNITLGRSLTFRPVDLQLKFAVNNLFDEKYLSVLSRPMPGINFEFFISVTPRFASKSK